MSDYAREVLFYMDLSPEDACEGYIPRRTYPEDVCEWAMAEQAREDEEMYQAWLEDQRTA